MAQSAESLRVLNDDAPEAVKLALRLALRGGRQERRRCLACKREGVIVKVWSPLTVWQVESQGREGIRVYWLCASCDERFTREGLPLELQQKLSC